MIAGCEAGQQSATEVRREELEAAESLARLQPIGAGSPGPRRCRLLVGRDDEQASGEAVKLTAPEFFSNRSAYFRVFASKPGRRKAAHDIDDEAGISRGGYDD